MSIERQFGAAVRFAREQRGWSQGEFAERMYEALGLSVGGQSGVARIEAGTRPTRLNEVALMARYLDIDLPRMLAGGDDVFSSNEPSQEEILRAVQEHAYLLKTVEILDRRIERATASLQMASLQLDTAKQERDAMNDRLRAVVFALHRVYPEYRTVGPTVVDEEAVQDFQDAIGAWPPADAELPVAGRRPDHG